MFDKVSLLAERAAIGLSRRGFLARIGRIGVSAMAFATFVGEATAANHNCTLNGSCCPTGTYFDPKNGGACYSDSNCHNLLGGRCIASNRCCGGTGYCGPSTSGFACFSAGSCSQSSLC
jgi:hypothetical protein